MQVSAVALLIGGYTTTATLAVFGFYKLLIWLLVGVIFAIVLTASPAREMPEGAKALASAILAMIIYLVFGEAPAALLTWGWIFLHYVILREYQSRSCDTV